MWKNGPDEVKAGDGAADSCVVLQAALHCSVLRPALQISTVTDRISGQDNKVNICRLHFSFFFDMLISCLDLSDLHLEGALEVAGGDECKAGGRVAGPRVNVHVMPRISSTNN